MSPKPPLLEAITLTGLEIAPPQLWGEIRIVPLLRTRIQHDLRLWQREYGDSAAVVELPDEMGYYSYVPHGLVLSWTEDGSPVASYGGQLKRPDGKHVPGSPSGWTPKGVRILHRMAKRESGNQLRLLPLHLAMEGYLSMYFSGPDVAWSEYSRYAKSQGLGVRWETVLSGYGVPGLEEALRVFEIHERQVGVLLFVGESLASAFVVPTSQDYRRLHLSLLQDFYSELMYYYGWLKQTTVPVPIELPTSSISSLSQLKAALQQAKQEWGSFHAWMAKGILNAPVNSQRVYSAGPFSLQRFITSLVLDQDNHIGEAIVRSDGELMYLKTFRLSQQQTRRVYLLQHLATYNWNLDATAQALNQTREDLVKRIDKAGFGYLFTDQVRQASLKRKTP